MRILFLSRWFPYPVDNGAKIRIFNLIKGLARKHTVDLVSFAEEEVNSQQDNPLKALCNEIVSLPYRPFQPYRFRAIAGYFSDKPRSVIDTYHEEFAAAVHKAIAKNQYDVLIASQIDMAVYGVPASVPVKIIEELEVTKILRPFQDEKRWLRKIRYGATWWKLTKYLRALLQVYDGCTVVSDEELAALQGIKCKTAAVAVIPNGVDTSQFQPAAVQAIEEDSLIYNGAITYPVNFEAVSFFIQNIFPLILDKRPKAHIYVTGKVTPELISRLPAHRQVVFTGYLPDIRSISMKCAVCVVPLLTGGGTRLKILESLASGIPVVSTSIGAEGLAVEDGKDLLIADSPDHFAQFVIELLNNTALREKLRSNGRSLVETHYDWRIINATFEKYLDGIWARKRPVGSV